MAGPVRRGEHNVSWATRTTDSSPRGRSEQSPLTGKHAVLASTVSPTRMSTETPYPKAYFSPADGRLVDSSPLSVDSSASQYVPDEQRTPGGTSQFHHPLPQSAPAVFGQPHRKFTTATPTAKHSLDQQIRWHMAKDQVALAKDESEEFHLDPEAPSRAVRANQSSGSSSQQEGQDKASTAPTLQSVAEEEEKEVALAAKDVEEFDPEREETWGDCFKVEWLCVERLPFYRTRHIRNPWNHDREVKVSRDGTELEPGVGQKLLEEWERLSEPQLPPALGAGKPASAAKSSRSKAAASAPAGVPEAPPKQGGGGGGGPSRS
ncbi:YT521-B-like domain-containing protein, partial [Crucibulum laeve]